MVPAGMALSQFVLLAVFFKSRRASARKPSHLQ
jgi:hypothetical protein